jgi:branched-chain amino acid transport system ATP-binding protein
MLAIARALMSEPRLLMLDEPSLGLAPVAVDRVFEALAGLGQAGRTILLRGAEHQPRPWSCDRGYLLERGRVVRIAPAMDLPQIPPLHAIFLGI